MPRFPLMLLAALAGATFAPPVSAQSQADSATADSAAAPAPKKGGLFGKLKKVAANKTVQGVARGVACNAVPGAAVAAQAAGSDACPAGGMGGMGGTGGGVAGVVGGGVGGAIGANARAATMSGMVPDGGAMQGMTGTAAMADMLAGIPTVNGMAVNEQAAARCIGISLQEYRDAMNTNPDAATRKRQQAVHEKLAYGRAGPSDMNACASMSQVPAPAPAKPGRR